MKRFIPAVLLLMVIVGLAFQARDERYFLNESDFLSQHPVSASEVRNRQHIVAEYDPQGRLLRKTHVNREGIPLSWEEYSYYDSTQTFRYKDTYRQDGKLIRRVVFGPEEHSLKYIEYVYRVDTVKSWKDRFTAIEYREDDQVDRYRFYDVDAFEYGKIQFEYDSQGKMTKQSWIKLPKERTMRWWDYVNIQGTDVTRIMEYDSNGVLVSDVNLSPDGTEAIFWFTSPEDSAYINHTTIAYRLDGDLDQGMLFWSPLTPGDTLRYPMQGDNLKQGEHKINLDFEIPPVDGLSYDIVFQGHSVKGYEATKRIIAGIRYDIQAPVLSLSVKPYLRTPEIAFTTNELLKSATLRWIPRDLINVATEVIVGFNENDIRQNNKGPFRLEGQLDLLDGTYYSVELTGSDRAGNPAEPVRIDSVLYDITPPKVEFIQPLTGAFINHDTVAFRVDEPLASWALTITAIGGKQDIYTPHELLFDERVLPPGKVIRDLSRLLQLNDGTVYRYTITSIDLAGNTSTPITVDSITFDITPPLVTMIFPYDHAAIKDPTVSYVINEPLSTGEMRWEQVRGTVDTLAPRLVLLEGEELTPGEKLHYRLAQQPDLVDGAVYTLTFISQDLAGNTSQPFVVQDILYDAVPPVFTNIEPHSSSALNHLQVSYEISENLALGTFTWTRTGGKPDPNSPYQVNLVEAERTSGLHENIILNEMLPLNDGSIYQLEITGSDRAGNTAEPVVIEDIAYDFTPPQLTLQTPQPYSINPQKELSYTLSETLYEGHFIWKWTGGTPDSLAPYTAFLTSEERTEGDHIDQSLQAMPSLVEGALYQLAFQGRDRAGNETPTVNVPGIRYDFTPPQIALKSPKSGTAVNHLRVSYSLSELLLQGTLTYTWVGGVTDPQETHIQALIDPELDEGIHEDIVLTNVPPLIDGATYTLTLSGIDPAGNPSNIATQTNIHYDITPPKLTFLSPQSYGYIASPTVSYELSETITEGTIIFIPKTGQGQEAQNIFIELPPDLLTAGVHNNVFRTEGPQLLEGVTYSIDFNGQDRAGNIAHRNIIQRVTFDATPPKLALLSPTDGAILNHTRVTYSNNEQLKEGTLLWIRTGGAPDNESPHTIILADEERAKGVFQDHQFFPAPRLVDGSIYRVEYFGTDPAGNLSDTVRIRDLRFDITPPTITVLNISDNQYSASTDVRYALSEPLLKGTITWEGRGLTGRAVKQSLDLPSPALQAGEHSTNQYVQSDLVDGDDYTFRITGQDSAGNQAKPVEIKNFHYDITPPAFTNLLPISGSFVNTEDILGYTLSEALREGMVLLVRSEPEQTQKDTFSFPLTGPELLAGEHLPQRLQRQPDLLDGSNYAFYFFGVDSAGNRSDTAIVRNITYDVSAPQFTIITPQANSYLRSITVAYSVNELLTKGRLVWVSSDEEEVAYSLQPAELEPGEHTLANYPLTLKENIRYSLYLEGEDRAGNKGRSQTVSRLVFDITPPRLAIISPDSGAIVNHTEVKFSVSEPLAEGTLTWSLASGKDLAAPHHVALKSVSLETAEEHEVTFQLVPNLKDSAQYNLSLVGIDSAGNVGQADTVYRVRYDVSPPRFTDLEPPSESYLNTMFVQYTLSEQLAEGKIILTQEGEEAAPKIIILKGSKLEAGPGGGELPSAVVAAMTGAVYRISFWGKDLAGNVSPSTIIENIHFDNEPPEIEILKPEPNTRFNTLRFTYRLSEDLEEANVEFIPSPKSQGISPASIPLTKKERTAGLHPDMILENLADVEEGVTYTVRFSGVDRAGNQASVFTLNNITWDTTRPQISVLWPIAQSEINAAALSYELSEDLAEGLITFQPTGPAGEQQPIQKIPLVGAELTVGKKDSIFLVNSPRLENGVVYNIIFEGQDLAGNLAGTQRLSQVGFDNEPPAVTISQPIDGEQIKNTTITYLLSDDLAEGAVIFERTGGTSDPLSPHIIPLNSEQRKQGLHQNVVLPLLDKLADGGRYSVRIRGRDGAGNQAEVEAIQNVLFDVRPPDLAWIAPQPGTLLNRPVVSFSTSEELLEGTLTFTQTGGPPDPQSPHQVPLPSALKKEGTHDQVDFSDNITLIDGGEYILSLEGVDLAGNQADPITLEGIKFDLSPPVIAIQSPQEGAFLQELLLDYTLSETLDSGLVVVTRRLGTTDEASPHTLQLTGDALTEGEHRGVNISALSPLVSGAIYDLSFSGIDLAGNRAEALYVYNLTIDQEPPSLAITKPKQDEYLNKIQLGVTVGEALKQLEVIFRSSADISNNVAGQAIALGERYFAPGEYPQVVLPQTPNLVSGEDYTIELRGSDRAGNESSVQIAPIHFDNTPPTIQDVFPRDSSFINNLAVGYTLSEPLQSGRFTWTVMGGAADPQSPHVVELNGNELAAGTVGPGRLTSQSDLNDGTLYELNFEGIDRAGNIIAQRVATRVYYDITAPRFMVFAPTKGDYLNTADFQFTVNEALSEGQLSWVQTGGNPDPGSPHVISFSGSTLNEGKHAAEEFPALELVSGAIYSFEIVGADRAGNKASQVTIQNLHFDTEAPQLAIQFPAAGAYLNHTEVAFSISEPLKEGTLTYTFIAGEGDPHPIHTIALRQEELTTLQSSRKLRSVSPPLTDGAVYRLEFEGMDLAGNSGTGEPVDSLYYDITKPKWEILKPLPNRVHIGTLLSY
ncbi:MAG: Ig-like domain-containing protein, partial [Fidelibacterota bacterium]